MTLPGPRDRGVMARARPGQPTFAAIDFETADRERDSACAVGVVRVENGRLTDRFYRLIRPPRKRFEFTHIHGLTWNDVRSSPAFGAIWLELQAFIAVAEFLVAHNAGFDREVLYRCCQAAGVEPPAQEFQCTLQLARTRWNLASGGLSAVCDYLGISLDHHHALSDAEACARIAIKALTPAM